jgi:hypothetical protein
MPHFDKIWLISRLRKDHVVHSLNILGCPRGSLNG